MGTLHTTLSSTQAAYIAGLFDGEGSVGIFGAKSGTKPQYGKYYRLRIYVTNNDRQVLEWLRSLFGGSICSKGRSSRGFVWILTNREQCTRFLTEVQPFCRIKALNVKIALEYMKLGKNLHIETSLLYKDILGALTCRR